MYFSSLAHSSTKPIKRPEHWASTEEQVEMFTQLCCIATDCSARVALRLSTGFTLGTVGWPDPDTMETRFTAGNLELNPPGLNERVQLVALNRRTRITCTTRFIGVDEQGAWILSPPEGIVSTDRRCTPRHTMRGWRVVLRGLGPRGESVSARVHDLSVGGMSFVVLHSEIRLKPGQPFVGVLRGSNGERIPLRATVCQIRTWTEGKHERLFIGASFHGFGVVNHARLARILAEQQEQTSG